MPIATVKQIKDELMPYDFASFGFTTDAVYEKFISERLNWAADEMLEAVGIGSYVATDNKVVRAEIYWTCYLILSREEKDADEGFQIGDFILYPPRVPKRLPSEKYWERVLGLISSYQTPVIGGGKIVALEDESDDDTVSYPPSQMFLRQA